MARLLESPRARARRSHYTSAFAGRALDRPARGGDLRLGRITPGELALGPLVPAARVVEVALDDVHDPVDPRRQRGLVLLDDLVRLLPVARRQELDGLPEGLAHARSPLELRRRGAAEDILAPRRRR